MIQKQQMENKQMQQHQLYYTRIDDYNGLNNNGATIYGSSNLSVTADSCIKTFTDATRYIMNERAIL